jgi:N-acetylglucosamine kinase-like BadF-type ATPase
VTHLAETLVAAVGAQGIAGLVRWSTVATTAQVAALGPVVVSTADQGDAVATEIVDQGVALLGKLASAAGAGPVPVALSGGLISAGRPLRERLMRQLVERQRVSVLEAPVDPCTGGPVLAERLIRR